MPRPAAPPRPPVARLAAAVLVAAGACLALASPTLANDSSAAFGVGGLVFTRNPAVAMRSEDLFLSAGEVRVRYVFENTSDADVTGLVAFPLPDIAVPSYEENIAWPEPAGGRAIDFTTVVDGVPVETATEERVFALNLDRTEWLARLNVPLEPQRRETLEATDALPRAEWDDLVAVGLARIEEYDDDGKGMRDHLVPAWTYRVTYYWTQTFPAGAKTVVEHRYRPAVGLSLGTLLGNPAYAAEDWAKQQIADTERRYCADKGFLAAAAKAVKAAEAKKGYLQEVRLDYILTTGANWAGAIGTFRLVVDKGAPGNLVSFCGEGVKKIGPTTFEMTKTDFVPTADLSVLILTEDFNALLGLPPAP